MIAKLGGAVMPKLLIATLLLAFFSLQWSLWGERGAWRWFELERANEDARVANEVMRERNEELAHKIDDLKTGVGTLEEQAREDLGMVKKGETFYRIIEPAGRDTDTGEQK